MEMHVQGLILHQPVKDSFVYSNQQKLVFLESYCRFEIRKMLWAAKDERHLPSCLVTVHHFLFLRPHHGWIHKELFEI